MSGNESEDTRTGGEKAPSNGPHLGPPGAPDEVLPYAEHGELTDEDGCEDWEEPSDEDIEEEDQEMLRRQRNFRRAAEYVARALAAFPSVDRVTLFGSVAAPLEREIPRFSRYSRHRIAILHECKDVDVAVHVNRLDGLSALRKASARAMGALLEKEGIGVAHHQVDIFLVDAGTERYLGNLCRYSKCPANKPACRVPGCGESAFLQRYEGFRLEPGSWTKEPAAVLFDRGAG